MNIINPNIIHLLFFALSLFPPSCKAQKECYNCGSALWKHRILNHTTNTFILPAYYRDRKVWFKDSLIIGEGLHVEIIQDTSGKEVWRSYVGEYTFVDLRTKSFYEYLTFSDTAKIVDKYMQPDTGRNKKGWNFFSTNSSFSEENLKDIPDTIINKIVYKRIESSKIVEITNPEEEQMLGKKQEITQIGYLRCDLIKTGLSLDKFIENKTGCAVLRLDQFAQSNDSYIVTEIEFLPGKLTSEELKVFAAWEKNEKEHPIKKNL